MSRVPEVGAFRIIAWLTEPGSPVPLGWFRVAVSLFCLFKIGVIRDSLMDSYGQYGFVQWALTRGNLDETLPHIGNIALVLAHVGLNADQSVLVVVGIHIAALVALLFGVAARCMALIAWCTHFLLIYAGAGLVYGMDYFTHIALFYCAIMPVGDALSLPGYLRGQNVMTSVAAGLTRRMLQIQMCIVYASSGLEKAIGLEWWNGEAVWRALLLPTFHRFDFSWLANVPWLAMCLG
jgi:hypothetical protein